MNANGYDDWQRSDKLTLKHSRSLCSVLVAAISSKVSVDETVERTDQQEKER